MPARTVFLFDASPINEPTDWMVEVCRATKLELIDNDAIAEAVIKEPVSIAELTKQGPGVGKHYLAAFEKLAKGKARVALNSVIWWKHGLHAVSGVVASFDQVDSRIAAELAATPMKLSKDVIEAETKRIKDTIAAAVKLVPKELLLVVSGSDADKAKAAIAFVKARGG